MIDPALFPDVEEVFCDMVANASSLINYHKSLVKHYNSWLSTYEQRLRNPEITAPEKVDAYAEIQETRVMRLESLSAIRRASALQVSTPEHEQKRRLKEDFQTICSLPQVIGASSNKTDVVSFVVHATHHYQGREFFIGRWRVSFGNIEDKKTYKLQELRSGVKDEWIERNSRSEDMPYPDYRLSRESFCMGSNDQLLDNLFYNGRYAQAMQLIAYVFCHVNEEDVENIPDAFKLETTNKLIEGGLSWPLSAIGPKLFTS
jgi:hypothetical protein